MTVAADDTQAGAAQGGPRLLLEDEQLLAVDKPPGRLVIPGRMAGEPSLREELSARHGPLWVVHRLDRGTSGVLLFARTAAAHRDLNMQFERGEPGKVYLALVAGRPPDRFERDDGVAPARKGRMKPVPLGDPRGKPARTAFRVLERFEPRGGAGPLADGEGRPVLARTPLHAASLTLRHPLGPSLTIEAPLPADLATALAALRR